MAKKVISVSEFIKKATRVIEIPGFEEGETIAVKIKPVSMLSMMTSGKLPNELLGIVADLFGEGDTKSQQEGVTKMLGDTLMLSQMDSMMKKVVNEVLVEPTFEEIGEYLTDAQLQAIFMSSQVGIEQLKPINEE